MRDNFHCEEREQERKRKTQRIWLRLDGATADAAGAAIWCECDYNGAVTAIHIMAHFFGSFFFLYYCVKPRLLAKYRNSAVWCFAQFIVCVLCLCVLFVCDVYVCMAVLYLHTKSNAVSVSACVCVRAVSCVHLICEIVVNAVWNILALPPSQLSSRWTIFKFSPVKWTRAHTMDSSLREAVCVFVRDCGTRVDKIEH